MSLQFVSIVAKIQQQHSPILKLIFFNNFDYIINSHSYALIIFSCDDVSMLHADFFCFYWVCNIILVCTWIQLEKILKEQNEIKQKSFILIFIFNKLFKINVKIYQQKQAKFICLWLLNYKCVNTIFSVYAFTYLIKYSYAVHVNF